MKPILLLTTLLLSLLMVACEFEREQNGYPKNVQFGPEGGTLRYKGDGQFVDFTLENANHDCESSPVIDDSISVTMDWLTVKGAFYGNEMIITAKPLTDGKSRKLKIYGSFGNTYSETVVTQKR